MVSQLLSLSVTMLVAALAPFVAILVPGRAIPEVVFLVFAGGFDSIIEKAVDLGR